jgi:valyl-tRNA synthetase
MDNIPKNYDHNIEQKWSTFWIENDIFSDNSKKISHDDFILILPPPNITGKLHIGHALNGVYQDLMLRTNMMKNKKCIWIPGIDHAGIATQTKVEKVLIEQYESNNQKFNKDKMGRQNFIKKIWDWKDEYGKNIMNQLMRLGYGCDWKRTQFTMDPNFSKLVNKMFVKLYNDNLIYQDEYIVNWCPVSKTALANEEVIYEQQKSELYYLKYYFADENNERTKDNQYLLVATTRPETIFGDIAIAFHPNDERYKEHEGKTVLVPIINKPIKVIKDIYPKPEFGTGLVKITPAHDINDFKVGQRHNLEKIKIINESGYIYNTNTIYDGLERFEARLKLVEDLKRNDYINEIKEYDNSIGRSYRSGAIVESLLSKQWFVRMKPLAEMVLKHESEINFYPKFEKEKFRHWLNNIQDWCISRQIWWGHQIPVWYGSDGSIVCQMTPPKDTESVTYTQDSDVLDTWFSSWLWPLGSFEPNESFYRNHIDTLVTGSDILFFWVIRMIMASVYLTGKVPFKNIYLHGLIRDEQNNKMSKSKGNVIDPLEVIDEYSADAIRFSLVMKTPYGQDVPFSHKDIELGRNFATKLWNTMRYIIDSCQQTRSNFNETGKTLYDDYVSYLHQTMQKQYIEIKNIETDLNTTSIVIPFEKMLDGFDLWIMSELHKTVEEYTQYYKSFHFSNMATTIYSFIWDKFCSIYLETTKYQKDEINKQYVLNYVLSHIIRLVHPIMPFVTEEIWHKISFNTDKGYKCITKSGYFPGVTFKPKSTNINNDTLSLTNRKSVAFRLLQDASLINDIDIELLEKDTETQEISYVIKVNPKYRTFQNRLYKIHGIEDENVTKYMELVKNIRSIKSVFGIPFNITDKDGTKLPFIHGNIVLNDIDSDLIGFIMDNITYIKKNTNIYDISMEKDDNKEYYDIKNNNMILSYPIDSYFKFDNKIKTLDTKINNLNKKLKQREQKFDKTESKSKKEKLNREISSTISEINSIKSQYDKYINLSNMFTK